MRRRNYGARTGRSILKRPGFPPSARSVRPENDKKLENAENMLLCGLYRHKTMKFRLVQKLVKIEAAELRSRRDRDRLKGNGETVSFERPELAANRQKN